MFLQPSPSSTCHYKRKIYLRMYRDLLWYLFWDIVCPFTLKTTEIYSLTFVICAKVFLQPSPSSTCHYKRKIYFRMYRDLLWYLFWLYRVNIHFKNHWNSFSDIYSQWQKCFLQPSLSTTFHFLFSDIYDLRKSVFATLTFQFCHYKGKYVWEWIGTSCDTFSDSIVRPFTIKNHWNLRSDNLSIV